MFSSPTARIHLSLSGSHLGSDVRGLLMAKTFLTVTRLPATHAERDDDFSTRSRSTSIARITS